MKKDFQKLIWVIKKIFSSIFLIKNQLHKNAPPKFKRKYDEIEEMGGFFQWLWKQYFIKKFEKIAHKAYNNNGVREAYDKYYKATDNLLSTLKGTSKTQRHIKSKKSKEMTKTAKGRQAHIDDMMKRWGYDE
tara:strand:+ start:254 stop:649 length:396 start_codon:yes stop_codon:yes gene_type:complete